MKHEKHEWKPFLSLGMQRRLRETLDVEMFECSHCDNVRVLKYNHEGIALEDYITNMWSDDFPGGPAKPLYMAPDTKPSKICPKTREPRK